MVNSTDIYKKNKIIEECLDPNQYILYLMREGYRVGLIDQDTFERLQTQIMLLLKDSIMRYTKGESTSVKTETAQSILLSVLYSINACISNFNHPDHAIDYLKAYNIKEIYEKGLTEVVACLTESKMLYKKIKNSKLDVPIIAYHSTIDEGLPEFFNNYDVLFSAQYTMASIDYPLLFDDTDLQGIFYIKQYLEKLDIETHFCSLFPIEAIAKVLFNYGKVYRIDYSEALINIFEIVLTNSIFSVLSGNNAKELSITQLQYELIQENFENLDQTLCSSLFNKAIEQLIAELHLDQPKLRDYIRRFKSVLAPRFLNALNNNSLANIIILDKNESFQFDVIFDEGKRMDDDSFRTMIDLMMECADSAEKTAIIDSYINSLGDFIDMLEADCLFGDEFKYLYNTLGDMELSILARIVFMEEMRCCSTAFSLQVIYEKPMDMEWQIEYVGFLQTLNKERLVSIEKYINSSFQQNSFSSFLE